MSDMYQTESAPGVEIRVSDLDAKGFYRRETVVDGKVVHSSGNVADNGPAYRGPIYAALSEATIVLGDEALAALRERIRPLERHLSDLYQPVLRDAQRQAGLIE